MTKYFNDAEIRGYHAGNESSAAQDADYTIGTGDDPEEEEPGIDSVEVQERASDYKGMSTINLNNTGGYYSNMLQHGDRIEFYVDEGLVGQGGYGTGGYGVGPYGGSSTRRWTGMVRPIDIDELGQNNYTMTITAEQFAPGVMDIRTVYSTHEDQPISGPDGIINEIITENCPELSTDRLPTVEQTTTVYFNGQSALQAVASMAIRAGMLLVTDGVYVDLAEPMAVEPEFTVESGVDVGVLETTSNDDNMVNQLRVEGGTGHDPESDAAQTTVDGYELVTDTDRITHQIQTRKSELERIEVWTHKTGSGEDFKIRLQKDDGGAPIAINDNKSDIVSKTLNPTFVDDDGFTGFLLATHTLPEPFPWLIIESGGANGQEIGINTASGAPGIIPHFPYEVILTIPTSDSIDTYRRREDKITDDDIGTFAAARDAGEEELARRDEPAVQVTCDAFSEKMQTLRAGDVVRFEQPKSRAVGDFVVVDLKDTYEIGQLNTTLTLEGLD